MSPGPCWGIFRERTHSPGRESDDAEILRLTGKALEGRGFPVSLYGPDEVGAPGEPRPAGIFLMGERVELLRQLQDWEACGTRVVNAPAAVLNTYRERMLALWAAAGVPFPRTTVVATSGTAPRPEGPVWVKRSDVHNTQDGDVVFAPSADGVAAALGGLARRGIPRAVIQAHVAGDLIKFYGVGAAARREAGGPWFRWFYHRDQDLRGHPFEAAHLARLARSAATLLGLEVFGGDALVAADGGLWLIDLNAWPSFALYRDEAAAEIAAYLDTRFTGAS